MSSNQSIIRIAKRFGVPEYSYGNIGCVSVKEDATLFIKSQDCSLATLSAKKIAQFDIDDLNEVTDNFIDYPPLNNGGVDSSAPTSPERIQPELLLGRLNELRIDDNNLDLQAEALIHNAIGYTYCLYLESAFINAVTCGKQGKQWVNDTFNAFALWVAFQPSSSDYAKSVIEKIKEREHKYFCSPQLIFFQNRGILISADSEEALYDIVDILSEKIYASMDILFDENPCAQNEKMLSALMDRIADLYIGSCAPVYHKNGIACSFCGVYGAKQALADSNLIKKIDRPLVESHLVCHTSPILFAEFEQKSLEKEFEQYVCFNKCAPKIIAIKGVGFFVIDALKTVAEDVKDAFFDQIKVAILTQNFGGPKFISIPTKND